MSLRVTAVLLACASLFGGCAHGNLPGTTIPATDDNRAIYDILVAFRTALENRDSAALTALVSKKYFEDNGTVDATDDYGYEELTTKVLPQSLAATKEMYLTIEIHDIVVHGDSASADIRYASRARLDLPAGTLWDSHREFNRVEFEREAGQFMIVKGL